MIAWVSLGAALGIAIGSCAQVEQGPAVIPPEIVERYCVKEVALISEVLAETDTLTSCISESTCDRAIDTGEEGYFETWHLYADETSTVVLDADSEFDNLMQLALITEVTERTVDTKVLVANDDRSADDSRAKIAATFEATRDYLLRLSSFGDEETGCYTIRTLRVAPDDPLPEPPDTGSVEVIVSSTGAAPVSYTVTLNGAKAKSVAANGTAMYEGIVTRDYAVALSGLGDCTVDGDNPQDVTVNADQTSAVSFTVSCELSGDCDPKDPNACNDANDCTDDICTASGTCEYSNADGNECDLMPGVGQCLDGACESLAAVCSPNPCNDDNECTNDVCKEENLEPVCSNDSKDKNAPCGPKGAQFCDGDGNCVECTSAGQCPNDVNECTSPACVDFNCGQSNVPNGTTCSGGTCQEGVCQQATLGWSEQGPHAWYAGRTAHAMAYAGSDRCVMFAGFSGGEYQDIWRYDLSADSWVPAFTSGSIPPHRQGHAMAYIGGDKVLMYGGTDPYQASYNDTWVFDLSDGTWAGPLGPTQFPSTRWSHAMVYVGEDKVLLFGGHHGGSSISSETWVYDLSDGEWTLKNPANGPAARYDHGMARIGADKALVFSGVIGTGGGGGVTDAETWVYDLSDNTWTPMSPPSTPPRRYGHAMASLGGDKVALFGGYGPSGGQYGAPLDDTWVYDLSEDAWSEYTESPYPSARFGHTFCETSTDGSRSVVMFGGAQDWLENDLSLETWIFDF